MRKNFVPLKGAHGLKHFNPNNMLNDFQNQVGHIFNDIFEDSEFLPSFGKKTFSFNPKFDVVETKTSYEVKAELPGLTEKDIEVTIDNNMLTVKGEKKEEKKEEKNNYYVSERSFGKFERTFELSKDVNAENIRANFKHGELSISIDKKEEEKSTVKKITVNS
jgi:HSP20 family protein